jgi:membrane-associated phospholipid phosphatase
MRRSSFPQLAVAVIVTTGMGCFRSVPSDAAFLVDWMNTYFAVARLERMSPPVASRVFAYSSVALYEAMAHDDPALRSLVGQLNGLDSLPTPAPGERLDWPSVATVAASEVLRSLLGEAMVSTQLKLLDVAERQLKDRTDRGVGARVREASAEYGVELGRAIAEWARRDGFSEVRQRPHRPPVGPGVWVNTTTPSEYTAQSVSAAVDYVAINNPAATLDLERADERSLLMNRPKRANLRALALINPTGALEPHWGELRPFVLTRGDECPAPPPARFSTSPGSEFYRQARRTYDAVRQLTDEQRRIAFFWADNPGQTASPPGHWISILSQVTAEAGLSPSKAVEALVLVSAALADAFITCWSTKYQDHVLRPVTYVRRYIDPDWSTVVVTPPFPEYTSGHSVASAAAAEILTAVLGEMPFTDATHVSIGHPPRAFASFRAAAAEAAISRLYGGIHYLMAIEAGLAQGRCVGGRVLQRLHTRPG